MNADTNLFGKLFKRPKVSYQDAFGTKHNPDDCQDWEVDDFLDLEQETHQEASQALLRAWHEEQDKDTTERTVDEEMIQGIMYQKGYNDGLTDTADEDCQDDPNYKLGFVDGRGDSDIYTIDTTPPENLLPDGSFSIGTTDPIGDTHNAVNHIMNTRKEASYYPVYLDGQTQYQCDTCHYTSPVETSVKNHIRLSHNYKIR